MVDEGVSSQDADDLPPEIPSDAPCIPAGMLDGEVLAASSDTCVLENPSIVILTDPLIDCRDVQTIMFAAVQRGTPLVIVAPHFSPEVISTLEINNKMGKSQFLAIALADDTQVRRVASYTGAGSLTHQDIAADWLPDDVWGTCGTWVSDADNSWIVA